MLTMITANSGSTRLEILLARIAAMVLAAVRGDN